jgi:predicted TIM-barrel fold metal-dependent hydrolase
MGHRGVVFSSHPDRYEQPYLADTHWDPIWAAAQELGMSVNFHIGSGGTDDVFGNVYEGNGRRINYVISSSQIFMTNATAIADVIVSGMTHRFPDLKFVSVESGVGWVPFFLQSLDWQWCNAGMQKYYPERLLPSEYFRRQFYCSFWFEDKKTIEYALASLGEDNILFETDYPHSTCQAPGPASFGVPAHEYIDQVLTGLPEQTVRKLLHDNAAALYRLEDDAA